MGPSGPGGTAQPSPLFCWFCRDCLDAPSALGESGVPREPSTLALSKPSAPREPRDPSVPSCVPGRALFHADSHPGKTCVGRDILDMSSGERGICAANGHLCHGPWHDMASRASSAPELHRACDHGGTAFLHWTDAWNRYHGYSWHDYSELMEYAVWPTRTSPLNWPSTSRLQRPTSWAKQERLGTVSRLRWWPAIHEPRAVSYTHLTLPTKA